MVLTPEECRHALFRAIDRDIRHNCDAVILQGLRRAMRSLTVSVELRADWKQAVWRSAGLRDRMSDDYNAISRCAAVIVCHPGRHNT